MFLFVASIFKLFMCLFRSRRSLLLRVALVEKENQILNRQRAGKRVLPSYFDRLYITILNIAGNIKDHITIVKPETVLQWQRQLIKHFWTFKHKPRKRGRKPVPDDIKSLIISMKNDNLCWGIRKIQGELMKLGIDLDPKTIWNILKQSRHKIRRSQTWAKFLRMQIESIYAMDLFTVDTILNKRFYVFFIIAHKTREVVLFSVAEHPTQEFIRQQIIRFKESFGQAVYMIHDNTGQFMLGWISFGIQAVRTSVGVPDMNAIAERFIGSVRREALDNYIMVSRGQIVSILETYLDYYNTLRPHQGIAQDVPGGYEPQRIGKIFKYSILSGSHHHYYRKAA